jgi:4-hydroxy-3-methylbut-2-en-1-yl diphosphate synthase IspG/GcpE
LGVGAACLAVLPGSAGASQPATATPVIMVHGYSNAACPGSDVGNLWSSVYAELAVARWSGPLLPVSFYSCDSDGVDISGYGPQPPADATPTIKAGAPRAGYTDAAGIEQVAHDLAWFVFDTYTSVGTPVDLVGASMGGLVVRDALYRVAAGDPAFPPALEVTRAVTISAPHAGVDQSLCGADIECTEMAVGSPFINDLAANASDPQGAGGTAWTVIGSSSGCDLVPASSALAMSGVTRVAYAQPCYTHAGYLYDGTSQDDAQVTLSGPAATKSETDGEHSLSLIRQVLLSAPGALPTTPPPADTTPPTVTLLTPSQLFGTARMLHISYTGSDTDSPVVGYDLRYRSARWDGGFSNYQYPAAWQDSGGTTVSTSVTPGTEYCYSARAHDSAGNASPWSAERCSAVPLDDRSLRAVSPGWTRQALSTAYAGTITETHRRGATLRLQSAHFDRLALVVVECPHCGRLGIDLNGLRWRTVNTYAAYRRPHVVLVQPRIGGRTATITLVDTDGKNLIFDGLALAH